MQTTFFRLFLNDQCYNTTIIVKPQIYFFHHRGLYSKETIIIKTFENSIHFFGRLHDFFLLQHQRVHL